MNRLFLTQSDSTPAHHRLTVPHPAPFTIFCVFLGSNPLTTHRPHTSNPSPSSVFAHSHYTFTSVPHYTCSHRRPTLHPHPLPAHTPILLPRYTLPFVGHSPPSLLRSLATRPAPRDTCSCWAGRGCAAAAPSPPLPPPRPTPPSIPHRLPGSRPARPPLRGGLRRRRRRKEPPFATAERTGRAEPDPGVGAGLGPGGRRWGAAPPQEHPGA